MYQKLSLLGIYSKQILVKILVPGGIYKHAFKTYIKTVTPLVL